MMSLRIWLLLLFIGLIACHESRTGDPHVFIRTSHGTIEVELYPKRAPESVKAFLSYVDAGLYNKASFYRVLNLSNQPSDYYKAELIQGGIWKKNNKKAVSIPGIPHESTAKTGIRHTNGAISLAREEPGTAGTEFFICIGDQPGFDYGGKNNPDGQGYAAFGKVVSGMDVVLKIYNEPEYEQVFDPQVEIFEIKN